uniref:Glycoside hydrolase family 2 immunoglobulin-like beta-sandwich domain-containing protein n=1 Tax=Parascaris equorum TaxID=6256 RepID=A0A914RHM5_PAREQ
MRLYGVNTILFERLSAIVKAEQERVIGMRRNRFTMSLIVHNESVELWWPNGYGKQRLYVLNASAKLNGEDIHATPIRIGFRRIELVQNLVDSKNQTKGRNFFFKLNGIPIFLKGD